MEPVSTGSRAVQLAREREAIREGRFSLNFLVDFSGLGFEQEVPRGGESRSRLRLARPGPDNQLAPGFLDGFNTGVPAIQPRACGLRDMQSLPTIFAFMLGLRSLKTRPYSGGCFPS